MSTSIIPSIKDKNVTIYVLNEVLRIQPIEVLGKLFIGGSGYLDEDI